MQRSLVGFLVCYSLSDALAPPNSVAPIGAQLAPAASQSSSRRVWLSGVTSMLLVPLCPLLAAAEDQPSADSLTSELLRRTRETREANAGAVASRQSVRSIPFGGVGEAPNVASARTSKRSGDSSGATGASNIVNKAASSSSSSSSATTSRFRINPYDAAKDARPFHTRAYGKEEYNNAFAASENTNVSPKEAYDTILSKVAPKELQVFGSLDSRPLRALDLGAGAGVSTEMLWRLGYREIAAVDWSDAAWSSFVEPSSVPSSVSFYALDDQRFLDGWLGAQRGDAGKFDTIVFNYAVNAGKATYYAKTLLRRGGRLLAPVNRQDDYWLKQEYRVYNDQAQVVWRAGEVGAWDVVFQPDMTEESCRGVRWCPETDRRSTDAEVDFLRPQSLTYKSSSSGGSSSGGARE